MNIAPETGDAGRDELCRGGGEEAGEGADLALPASFAAPHDSAGDYPVGRAVGAAPGLPATFDDVYPLRLPMRPPRSRGEFLATVYLFPWRREVIWRWLLLSAGATPAALLVGAACDGSRGRPFAAGFALLIAALPLAILLLGTAAFGVALFNCIFDATAGGADDIEAWPDADWTDWLGQLFHLVYVAAISVSLGLIAGRGLALAWGALEAGQYDLPAVPEWQLVWGGACAVIYVTFPFVLISTQFADSPWAPMSLPVVQSLFRCATGSAWFLFVAAAIPLALLPAAQIAFARHDQLLIAAAGFGPQLAAAGLIYARLLGRLAWEIGTHLPAEEGEAE